LETALAYNQLDCFKYLFNSSEYHESDYVDFCCLTIEYDLFDTFVLIISQRYNDIINNDDLSTYAARYKGTKYLKYLYNKYHIFENVRACAAAAQCGNLENLVYLHEICKCPWDEKTTLASFSDDTFECFKYAIENGCPISKDIKTDGHQLLNLKTIKCLEYLYFVN
jgi:hypothetical protein